MAKEMEGKIAEVKRKNRHNKRGAKQGEGEDVEKR